MGLFLSGNTKKLTEINVPNESKVANIKFLIQKTFQIILFIRLDY